MINQSGADNPYEIVPGEEGQVTAPSYQPQFELPEADTTSGYVEPTKSFDTTLVDDIMNEKESEYSKLRSVAVSKEDTKAEMQRRMHIRTTAGQDPDKAYKELFGDGSVRWNKEKFEVLEQTREKVSNISAALGAINIDMVDIVSGNLSEQETKTLTAVGEHGVKEGWFDYYNIHTGIAYTPEGVPIPMNSGGIQNVIMANLGETAGAVAGGIMLPMVVNPATAVPVVSLGIAGSMVGAGVGRVQDIKRNEALLADQNVTNKPMNGFELFGEGVDAAVTDGVLGKAIHFIGSKGTSIARGLFQSLAGKNTKSAIGTISELTGLTDSELTKRGKEYARMGGIEWNPSDFEAQRNIILRNEIENNPSLQGYLTKVVEEPAIAQMLRKNVSSRTSTLNGIGASSTVDGMLGMVKESDEAAKRMMGSVRGALDDSFEGIELPTEQLKSQMRHIREGLAPYMATVEERGARGALDKINASMATLDANPSLGQLFKVRTDLNNLLRKVGMFEEGAAVRSQRLGTVDTPSLSSTYRAIDNQIDTVIKNTPYLDNAAKRKLLDFKHTSDVAYSAHMKAMNTKWVKGLMSEGATAKKSLDKLMVLGKEGRTQYDTIMENMSKSNQDALEQSMVRRSLDKVKVGKDGYSLGNASDDLLQLRPRIKNPQALDRLDSTVQAAKLFEQDPVISMIANHRMVLDKLAKAGLTYNPKASLLYGMWSKTFPRLQTSFVNIIEQVPGLKHIMAWNPMYGAIKTSAKEINVANAAKNAFETGQQTDFKRFLDRALASDSLPAAARKSIQGIAKEYAKLASSFEGNQAEIKKFMNAVKNNPDMAGPIPPSAPKGTIEKLRKEGHIRQANAVARAEREREIKLAEQETALATALEAKGARITELENKVTMLKEANQVDTHVAKIENELAITEPPVTLSPRAERAARMETAAGKMEPLREVLGSQSGMDVTGSSDGVIRISYNNSPRSSFTIRDGVVRANTSGLVRGSGAGAKIYSAVWDGVEAVGLKAQPTSGMFPVNRFRMTVNMLQYVAKRRTDARHVLLYSAGSKPQVSVPSKFHGLPLTMDRAKVIADNFKRHINRYVLPTGVNIKRTTTDEQLQTIVDSHQASRAGHNKPFGFKTAKLLRDYMRTGNLRMQAAILGVLGVQSDFVSLLEGADNEQK